MIQLDLNRRLQHASTKTKLRLTSASSWTLPKESSSVAPDHVWSNADQDPVPPERQTWSSWDFTWYWFSDLVTASGWAQAASIVALGLSATDALLITFVAAVCNSIPTVLNGCIGADLHVPFPIGVRASYGYYFSYFTVVTRAIIALFWFGVNSAFGAQCITVMLTAIWPSFATVPNYLPASAAITTQGMVSYLLYWLLQFPFLLIPTHKIQYLFYAKTILVLPTALAMIIWISVKAGGGSTVFNQPAKVQGAQRVWLWLSALTSATGSYSTLSVNISDFTRFSSNRRAHIWQLFSIPLFKCIVAVFGVVGAGASTTLYGKTLWSPLTIMAYWQGSSGGRAAAFFAAAVWLLAQICVNISANAISFSNDITSLAPKWFNARRGAIVCAVFGGWALCPWIIVASATSFLAFMGGYAFFMAPIAGIMITDYWVVKKRKYDVPALYDPQGIYGYKYGTNWRALVTTVLVVVPLLPGLVNRVDSRISIGEGMSRLFAINWLYGFALSIVLYLGLNYIAPDQRTLLSNVVDGTPARTDGESIDSDVEKQTETVHPKKVDMEPGHGGHTATA